MRILQINYTPASILEGVASLLTFTFKVIGDYVTQEELRARLVAEATYGIGLIDNYECHRSDDGTKVPLDEYLQEFVTWSMSEAETTLGTWFRDLVPEDSSFEVSYGDCCENSPGQRNISDELLRFLRSKETVNVEPEPYEDAPWLKGDGTPVSSSKSLLVVSYC